MGYDFKKVEKKWQNIWDETKVFEATYDKTKKKYYALVEFPYPSAEGLHVGHPRSYVALDIIARKRRMEGFNVLYPMGWDAFGLPTENFAIKNKIHPKIVTKKNIEKFKKQLKSIGISFDWSKEFSTTDEDYYKWTQWIFIQMFKKGLAYKKEMAVNWCTDCSCVLANEEVVNGKCERCGGETVQKNKSQWMLKITKYAEELLEGLKLVDFIKSAKIQQQNWIGKSRGALICFKTTENTCLEIYSTRPETIFGASFMALAPEHDLIKIGKNSIENIEEILNYKEETVKKSSFERSELSKEKTGIEIKGIKAINPVNGETIPIYVADYVLSEYGTGAVMGVAAHDSRDFEFAKKYSIPFVNVLEEKDGKQILINSQFLNGLETKKAKEKIIEWLEKNKIGKAKTNYKLRDWIFARQRYWGEPIPIIHCPKCKEVTINESELPLKLPKIKNFKPTKNGESPLAEISEFVNVKCPKCGADARRETDTMPQWAGSSWYYLRYCDPNCTDRLASKEKLDYWLPVDWYNGGMEHTTLHLLYSRFWHKFLYEIGIVNCKEPYLKRTSHGMILGQNGEKMSKSKGNVVNPDEIVNQYGADGLRLYEMFMGDFEKATPWNTSSIKGCKRFLEKIWNLQNIVTDGPVRQNFESDLNNMIKKVTQDIENMKFNTAISAIMIFLNKISASKNITREEFKIVLTLLNPFAPHITEELNHIISPSDDMLCKSSWPSYSEKKSSTGEIEIVVQICGKIKARLNIPQNLEKKDVLKLARNNLKIKADLSNRRIIKQIFVKNKLVNFVVD